MATYQDIKGLKVKYLSADPGTLRAGEVWYNSTTGTLKGVVNFETWASGTNMSTARQGTRGTGIQTAGIIIDGAGGPATGTFINKTEEYNGSGWASGGDTNITAIARATFGTATAAVAVGGLQASPNITIDSAEEYNGSSWTAVTACPQATRSATGMGIETSGLVVGGEYAGTLTNTQEYNGSAWGTGGVIPTGNYNAAGGGTLESNSWFAGGADGFHSATLLYSGTTWTASGSLNTARDQSGGAGISTAALIFGGRVPPSNVSAVTESFDGSTWTTSPATLGTAARQAAGWGTQTAALMGGNDPASTITQLYNNSSNTITSAAWASITAYPTECTGVGGVGSSTAGLFFGGESAPGPVITTSTTYDGSSWTAANAKGTASQLSMNFGTQTSAVAAGGEPVPGVGSQVEEWGGTSWSTAPNTISVARRNGGGSGSGEPSGVIFGGGEHPSYSTSTEGYDGTTWTGGGALPNGKAGVSAGDSATAALFFGDAQNPSPPYQSNVSQEYNGSSWTATPSLLIERGNGPSGASTGANSGGGAYYAGGTYPSLIASMESYDGSAWYTSPSLGTAVWNQGGNGSTAGALSVAGSRPAYTTASEEFTAETSVASASTLTTS